MHEITAHHQSLSRAISCVTDRIRFLPVTMTGRFSNFNSRSYTEDWHEFRVTGTMRGLPGTMSGTGEIFISGAGIKLVKHYNAHCARMCKSEPKCNRFYLLELPRSEVMAVLGGTLVHGQGIYRYSQGTGSSLSSRLKYTFRTQ